MQASQQSLVPDLDLNPPTSWSKPANALGLSNPLNHLPQSEQVQMLHQQIEHHRQLQRSTLHGNRGGSSSSSSSSKGKKSSAISGALSAVGQDVSASGQAGSSSYSDAFNNQQSGNHNNSSSSSSSNRTMHQRQAQHINNNGGFGVDAQHINIRNINDEDSEMSGGEDHEGGVHESGERRSSSRGSSSSNSRGMNIKMNSNNQMFHHHRSISNPHISNGFGGLQGFTPFSPGSPISPSSQGSFTSDGNSFSAPMISPGLFTSHSHTGSAGFHYDAGQSHHFNLGGNNSSGAGGIENPLASLAALSVMTPMPVPPRRISSGNSGFTSSLPFQSQSLPVIHQNIAMSSDAFMSGSSQQNAFTSALGQQIQLQRQQQQYQQEEQQLQQSQPIPSQSQDDDHHRSQQQRSTDDASSSLLTPTERSTLSRPSQAAQPRRYLGRQSRKHQVNNIVKEVVEPTRRMAHILSEQKRREKINGGFDELKSVIPE
ncbi:hypothetical protein BGZ58_003007 [Dissophora ornata]|nr:hypothetical protein BGZ58_003007 [Dissophora ornata]